MNTMKATTMKVISAIRKSPMLNTWFINVVEYVAKFDMPGIAKPKSGIMKSLTSARTRAPKYKPKMKAAAKPRILYFDRKSLNSFYKPFGGWGIGAFSKAALIFFNSTNISSSLSTQKTSTNWFIQPIFNKTCGFLKRNI